MLATFATGCDTVALIAFSEREFQGIETSGFTATSGSCGGIEDGRATLRFVLRADDSSPIRPGDTIGQTEITGIAGSQIEFGETAVYETPDLLCADNADCRIGGMSCQTGPGIPDESARRCQLSSSISLDGDVQFESDTTKNQLFGVLFENSGSLEGWLPSDVAEKYPDWDEDGTAEGSDDVVVIPNRASDLTGNRKAALTIMIQNWVSEAERSIQDGRTTSFGLWEFKGTAPSDVVSLVDTVTPADSPWTSQRQNAEASRNEFERVSGTRANVFQAVNTVIDDAYAPEEYSNHEKTMVVFVDGPDDLRFPTHTAQSVIDRASELGIRIFIVHLDPAQEPTTQAGTPVFRDDYQYWNRRIEGSPVQSTCSDDSDCKNFESCRVPLAYSSVPNAPVEISPMGDTYCMPDRDENGRIGPIEEYARIACATDGGYIYVKGGSGLRPRMSWLPFSMDGLWKVDTAIGALENQEVPSEEAYKFQTTMSVTVGGDSRSYDFSQRGEATADDDSADTRAVLFN
jgi:hypothetical protein